MEEGGAAVLAAAGSAAEPLPMVQEAPDALPPVADDTVYAPPSHEQEQQADTMQQKEKEQEQQADTPQPQQQQVSTPQPAPSSGVHQLQIYLQMVVQQQGLQPGICKRGEPAPTTAGKVLDWGTVKKSKTVTSTKKETPHQRDRENPRSRWAQQRAGVQKIAGTAGRTFTSRFRGVHQTFPTKRWEAQFRRNGKPTSLGCFDQEDEAARAYDRMMLWCEIHNAAGSMKGSVTNFDLTEYEKDITWLTNITQDDLIEALRSEGRKQAMNRANHNSKSRGGARSGGWSEEVGGEDTAQGADMTAGAGADADEVATRFAHGDTTMTDADAAAAAAAAMTAAAAAGVFDPTTGHLLQDAAVAAAAAAAAAGMGDQEMQDASQAGLSVALPGAASAGAMQLTSPEAAAATAAFLTQSPAGALTAASPEALSYLFGSIGQDAFAAVQQLQQQLDQAAASGVALDADAATAAAFQIGQIAGTNMAAALSANPSPAAGAAAAGAAVPLPFGVAGHGGSGHEALAAYGLDDSSAAAALAAVGGEDMTAGLQAEGTVAAQLQ